MNPDFEPKNELETKLLDAQEGRIPPQAFIDTLMTSEVFMPVYEKQQIGGFAPSSKAKPLTLKDEDSGEDILILFTSPDRAKEFVRDYPGYGGGLVTEFTWVLEKLGVGYSIALNPGHQVGIDLEAATLEQLASNTEPSAGAVRVGRLGPVIVSPESCVLAWQPHFQARVLYPYFPVPQARLRITGRRWRPLA